MMAQYLHRITPQGCNCTDAQGRKDAPTLTMEQRTQCKPCGRNLPIEMFPKNKARTSGRGFYCRACHSARSQAWKKANPEKVTNQRVRRKVRASGDASTSTFASTQQDG